MGFVFDIHRPQLDLLRHLRYRRGKDICFWLNT